MRKLELLAPAADKDVAMEAILHGADAVYMGASSHGARKSAANSVKDIAEVVCFAHKFRAKVYVTVNTLVYDNEIAKVESLVRELYTAGVDAIIVQDMGLLRMDIPPIELHASTQCDTRDVAKARFLEDVGFSQIVLARELGISEIKAICDNVSVPVEVFVHGALCVSYSGRCRASFVQNGRSANRGECAQMCRLPYSLVDSQGRMFVKDKYLLSLKDFNASMMLTDLIEAGVSSFKIEGRLKDVAYVKNITAYYRKLIDAFISAHPDRYCRSSYGNSEISFVPDPDKSFNRGFTSYFLEGRKQKTMASLLTPKSLGERIDNINELNNGDGISFINSDGEYEGVRVNRVERGRIVGARPFRLPEGCEIRRTFNREWQSELDKPTAKRYISVDISIDENGVSATDERGVEVRIALDVDKFRAEKKMQPEKVLSKLGNTIYQLRNLRNELDPDTYIPASQLNAVKRKLTEALDVAAEASYCFNYRKIEKDASYVTHRLESDENVANTLAEDFYRSHGCVVASRAIETTTDNGGEVVVMNTRYCIRRELGCCKKIKNGSGTLSGASEPLYIESGRNRFRLMFDCSQCEMKVIREGK